MDADFFKELKCSICFEWYGDDLHHLPKQLNPCSHMFCVSCISRLAYLSNQFNCPKCKSPVRLPADGVNGLATCIEIRNLAVKFHRHQSVVLANANGCPHVYQSDSVTRTTRTICSHCNLPFCDTCLRSHIETRVAEQQQKLTDPSSGRNDERFKIVVVGAQAAGKTALVNRFTDDTFIEHTRATVGMEYRIQNVRIQGKNVRLSIFDAGGHDRFRSLIPSYYRGCQGIIFAYDITDRTTLAELESFWFKNVNDNTDGNICKMLVGCKADLAATAAHRNDVVTFQEGASIAQKHGMPFQETSAKTAAGVNKAFIVMSEQLCRRFQGTTEHPSAASFTIKLANPSLQGSVSESVSSTFQIHETKNNKSCCKS